MYEYNAKVDRVVDGDTIDCTIDLGFSTWKKIRVRMEGINTPESRTRDKEEKKRGLAAKNRLVEILECNGNNHNLLLMNDSTDMEVKISLALHNHLMLQEVL